MASVFDEDFLFFSNNKEVTGSWCATGCEECCYDGIIEEFRADEVNPEFYAHSWVEGGSCSGSFMDPNLLSALGLRGMVRMQADPGACACNCGALDKEPPGNPTNNDKCKKECCCCTDCAAKKPHRESTPYCDGVDCACDGAECENCCITNAAQIAGTLLDTGASALATNNANAYKTVFDKETCKCSDGRVEINQQSFNVKCCKNWNFDGSGTAPDSIFFLPGDKSVCVPCEDSKSFHMHKNPALFDDPIGGYFGGDDFAGKEICVCATCDCGNDDHHSVPGCTKFCCKERLGVNFDDDKDEALFSLNRDCEWECIAPTCAECFGTCEDPLLTRGPKPGCKCECLPPKARRDGGDFMCIDCTSQPGGDTVANKYICSKSIGQQPAKNTCIDCPPGQNPDANANCACVAVPCKDVQGNVLLCKERVNGQCVDKQCPAGVLCDSATGNCDKCPTCTVYEAGNTRCSDPIHPAGCDPAPLGVPVPDGNVCKCFCRTTNQEKPADGPCPGQGDAGPFSPPGGGGGGGGDGGGGDGGGGEEPNPCGDNASLDSDSGLCYCDIGYVTMDGNSQCSNCAPGYVRDANGGCCDPFNTPGGCDGVGATGFLPEEHLSSMCDGVDCPEGQSCFQSVFGAECR